ncbi:MAG: hypothetical protein ACKVU4_09995 [Phycisphaerales bacterium]
MAFRGPGNSARRRGSGRVIAPAVGLALLMAAPAFAQRSSESAAAPIAPDTSIAPYAPYAGGPNTSLVMLQDGVRRLAAANTRGGASLPAELAAEGDWSGPTPQPVPLPASALAGGAGLAGLWVFHRLRRRSHASHR